MHISITDPGGYKRPQTHYPTLNEETDALAEVYRALPPSLIAKLEHTMSDQIQLTEALTTHYCNGMAYRNYTDLPKWKQIIIKMLLK